MQLHKLYVTEPTGTILLHINKNIFLYDYCTSKVFYDNEVLNNHILKLLSDNEDDSDKILIFIIDESYDEGIRCAIKIENLNKYNMLLNKKSENELVSESTKKELINKEFEVLGIYLHYNVNRDEPLENAFVRKVYSDNIEKIESLIKQHFEEQSGDSEWKKLKSITTIREL